jgi:thioredoxin-related protein
MLRNHCGYFQTRTLLALMLTACGAALAGEPAGSNWHRDWRSAWQASQAQSRPILLFVSMEHCYHCTRMCRTTYSDNQVRQDIEGRFVLASIDSGRNPDLVRRLNVRLFPTTLIIGSDGQVIDAMPGYLGPQQLRSRLKTAETRIASR